MTEEQYFSDLHKKQRAMNHLNSTPKLSETTFTYDPVNPALSKERGNAWRGWQWKAGRLDD